MNLPIYAVRILDEKLARHLSHGHKEGEMCYHILEARYVLRIFFMGLRGFGLLKIEDLRKEVGCSMAAGKFLLDYDFI
jgi:hypothetical protein